MRKKLFFTKQIPFKFQPLVLIKYYNTKSGIQAGQVECKILLITYIHSPLNVKNVHICTVMVTVTISLVMKYITINEIVTSLVVNAYRGTRKTATEYRSFYLVFSLHSFF